MRGLWCTSEAVTEALPDHVRSAGSWLAPEQLISQPSAHCFRFDPTGLDIDALDAAAEAAGADLLIVPDARIQLCLFDMDSTLIQHEVIDELAAAFGIGPEVAAITERSMAGELDFVESFTERLALLKGLSETHLQSIAMRLQLMPGAQVLLENLTALGVRSGIVSGGFSYFADRIGAQLGMDFVVSNTLECVDGAITGSVVPPVIDGSAKVETLVRERDRMGLGVEHTMAVGDGANDIPMLKEAGVGVAFRAKPIVAASASHRLRHCDLSALSYLLV